MSRPFIKFRLRYVDMELDKPDANSIIPTELENQAYPMRSWMRASNMTWWPMCGRYRAE